MRLRKTLVLLFAIAIGPMLALSAGASGFSTTAFSGQFWMAAQQGQQQQGQQPQGQQRQGQQQQGQQQQQQQGQNIQVESALTKALQEKMPTDSIQPNSTVTADSVIFWTRVNGVQQGDSISVRHVWSHNGEEAFEIELPVKGPSWRTWSYNTIGPNEGGEWQVTVYGPQNEELASTSFTVQPTGEQAQQGQQQSGQMAQRNGQEQPMNGQQRQQDQQAQQQNGQMAQRNGQEQPMNGQQRQQDQQMGQASQEMQKWSSFAQQCLGPNQQNVTHEIHGTVQQIDTLETSQNADAPSGLQYTIEVEQAQRAQMNGQQSQQQNGQQREQDQQAQQNGQQRQQSQQDQQAPKQGDELKVYLGPDNEAASALRGQISEDDQVILKGTQCEIDGEQVFVATSIQKNGQTFELTTKNGAPKWESKSQGQEKSQQQQRQQQPPDQQRQGGGR